MQDENLMTPAGPVRHSRTGRRLLTALVLLLLLAGLLGAWLVWRGTIEVAALTGRGVAVTPSPLAQPAGAPLPPAVPGAPAVAPPVAVPGAPAVVASPVEMRLALLEERLSRLDLRAEAASGNAARAEGLLIAFAARRTIDRGAPLGYLEDQLKLRFADAQPNAVRTIIEGATAGITRDTLLAQLDSFGLRVAGIGGGEDSWARVRREVSGLFVIRRESVSSLSPRDRLERAKVMLASGKTDEAIAEVRRLPAADIARDWIAAAQRYEAVQRALDLIETTAMLDEHRLQDGAGNRVEQTSPLAGPPRRPCLRSEVPSI